jgi:hypothetical protein
MYDKVIHIIEAKTALFKPSMIMKVIFSEPWSNNNGDVSSLSALLSYRCYAYGAAIWVGSTE